MDLFFFLHMWTSPAPSLALQLDSGEILFPDSLIV